MKEMTIRAKLIWAFGGLTMMVLLVAGIAIKEMANAQDDFDNFVHGINARLAMVNNVIDAVNARAIAARNIVLVTKPEDLQFEKNAAK